MFSRGTTVQAHIDLQTNETVHCTQLTALQFLSFFSSQALFKHIHKFHAKISYVVHKKDPGPGT